MLVEEGYVRPDRIKNGCRLQKMLVRSVLAALLSLGMSTTSSATTVMLQWDANSETDLAGYKVYHSPESSPLEGTIPLDVSKQTTATISGLDHEKSYRFAVTAYNASGVESSYSNIVSIEEQSPPTVAISSPADNINVSGVISINVNASDNVGVTKVEYYVNGELKGTDTSAPYVYSWDTVSLASGPCTLMVKAYDAAGNVSQSSRSVTIVHDLIAPTVALTSPANNATLSGTVTISSSASDNVGVTMVEYYSNDVFLFASNVSPFSYSWNTKSVSNGSYSILAKAYDNAGNSSQSSVVKVTVSNPVPDVTAPSLNTFILPAVSTSLTVAVSSFTASDTVGVSGYLITESATKPAATAAGWAASAPTSFTFSAVGSRTAYAWARDAAGNVSASRSAAVTITLPDVIAPTVSAFSMPATATSLTVAVSSLTASDTVGVSGYLITESATKPAATAAGWTTSAPTSFTFTAAGTKNIYAWAKDAAGNVSASRSASVTITLPDISAPTVSAFTLPASATSLTVAVSSFTASDTVGVSGYLITESATKPAATAAGWSVSAPTSFTFSAAGTKTIYAWAKDAAGNVSASRSASVTITLPETMDYTISDALLALQIGSGQVTPTAGQVTRLDVAPVVNGVSAPNAVVNTGDAIVLLSKVAGKTAL